MLLIKNQKILIIVMLGVCVVIFTYWFIFVHAPGGTCIQMVQDAKNPLTGEVKTFSSPCTIPMGWQKIGPVILN